MVDGGNSAKFSGIQIKLASYEGSYSLGGPLAPSIPHLCYLAMLAM